ncbi:protein of unknown function [Modestobacter sp. DSM 44400]|uniref:DUF1905 domain-containing protein n=1 Tax=Modestobacter sp. DSM 44400 TaxID=1550230 RepID=UPI00089C15E0|nr:DUF1905 domain-containing protein [Modestobacter sp. DSM 44400]SDY18862.1 protein of unknown function [Modestobacter sp. DSM 44400]
MGDPGRDLEVTGDVWHWRGPAPFFFVTVPADESQHLHAVSTAVTYGWGMIPVRARIGATEWTTSLFPKDGLYLVPVKDAVRRAEELDEGDTVTVRLTVAGGA